MMHSNGFIICVQDANKNVLREIGDKVFLPFHSEYSLRLKNNHGVRALAEVSIDGTDVLGGSGLIVDSWDTVDLERFIVDGDLNAGQHFKFIPLGDGEVADPTEPQNGIVKVTFWKEKPKPIYFGGQIRNRSLSFGPPIMRNDCFGDSIEPVAGKPDSKALYTANCDVGAGEPGATVAGSKSDQKFTSAHFGEKELSPTVITLHLVGKKDCPLTVKDTKKMHCTECGKKVAFKDKFCKHCGTSTTGLKLKVK